jgi:hypothetical protein
VRRLLKAMGPELGEEEEGLSMAQEAPGCFPPAPRMPRELLETGLN